MNMTIQLANAARRFLGTENISLRTYLVSKGEGKLENYSPHQILTMRNLPLDLDVHVTVVQITSSLKIRRSKASESLIGLVNSVLLD